MPLVLFPIFQEKFPAIKCDCINNLGRVSGAHAGNAQPISYDSEGWSESLRRPRSQAQHSEPNITELGCTHGFIPGKPAEKSIFETRHARPVRKRRPGRARASLNNTRHGMRSQTLCLPHESLEEVPTLLDDFQNRYQPTSPAVRRCGPGRRGGGEVTGRPRGTLATLGGTSPQRALKCLVRWLITVLKSSSRVGHLLQGFMRQAQGLRTHAVSRVVQKRPGHGRLRSRTGRSVTRFRRLISLRASGDKTMGASNSVMLGSECCAWDRGRRSDSLHPSLS